MLERRDYSLTGPDAQRAVQNGLAQAQWYSCPIGRQELKALMRRRNGPGIRDTLISSVDEALFGLVGEIFGIRRQKHQWIGGGNGMSETTKLFEQKAVIRPAALARRAAVVAGSGTCRRLIVVVRHNMNARCQQAIVQRHQ